VDITQDRIDYQKLPDHEKHIFISNLKYQTLLDSIQGRSPNMAFLPLVSLPELETWIETWAFSETIHSRSYTHILRNIVNDPSVIFDDIMRNENIKLRAGDISSYYDDLIRDAMLHAQLGAGSHTINGVVHEINVYQLKKKMYLCLMNVNILEAIRFYVSFACSFAFAERKLMEGNAKIIRLIARDEALHLTGTQHLLNIMRSGQDDPDFAKIAKETEQECFEMFKTAAMQEKQWAEYLFRDGSMIGLNKDILSQYVEYITNIRMSAIGLKPAFENAKSNPIPWINTWLSSDTVQVAPQEVELSSYLVGQINAEVSLDDLSGIEL
jgi:ribonucleoside-diphosphate reductase beta chain